MRDNKKKYGKYIILSSPRSGTHMIRTVLRNHPNLVAHSELFNPDFIQDKPYGTDTPAADILQQFIYRDYFPEIQKVGFIIHRSGTPFGDWPDLWQLLEEDPDLFVISLRRRNLLRRYLSYQTMRTFRGATPQALYFDPEVLEADFIFQTKEIQTFDERFKDHPLLKIHYEDLCNHFHPTMRQVFDFLEVKPQKIWPDEKAKPRRKLSDAIENFEALKDHFSGTEWASFFKDEAFEIPIAKPKYFLWKEKVLKNWRGLKSRTKKLFDHAED